MQPPLFEISSAGWYSAAEVDATIPRKKRLTGRSCMEGYRFPPKKRRFDVSDSAVTSPIKSTKGKFDSRPSCSSTSDVRFDDEHTSTQSSSTSKEDELNLEALTYYPSVVLEDDDDVSDVSDDGSGDDDVYVAKTQVSKQGSHRQVVTRASSKRRRAQLHGVERR